MLFSVIWHPLALRLSDPVELYGNKAPAILQKIIITAIEVALIGLSVWIMFGPGETILADLFDWPIPLLPPARRTIILLFSLAVLARMAFAMFFLMKRNLPWSEVISVPLAFALYYVGFAILVLPNHMPIDLIDIAAIAIFILGSWLNTAGEIQRDRFKKSPQNKGKLFTGGLFSLSMHVNFFGDILWVIAYALVARNPWGTLIPVFITAFFAFFNVPMLDKYLAEHYGTDFKAYAAKTKRLIPFVW